MDKMTDWKIERYSADNKGMWDAFVKESRNATFLHLRDYMDYHADRFTDHSLLAYKSGKLRALLPAEVAEEADGSKSMGSHRGLTYGGWLLPQKHIDGEDVLHLFEAWCEYCRSQGISGIDYKPVPHIYHRMPSEDDVYALLRVGARPDGYTLSSTIEMAHNPGYNGQQHRNAMRFAKSYPDAVMIQMKSDEEADEFHALLSACLKERHDASPVHTLSELKLLRNRFPDNIKIYGVKVADELMAAVCMYLTDTVAHSQYIASSREGRERGALAWMFKHLIEEFKGYRYFDFGISCEDRGRVLNSGLLRQKTGLGGGATVYPRFTLSLISFSD